MFASIRRYRLRGTPMGELARRVDEDFAERIAAQPGFMSYEFVDCGDGELLTISTFQTAEEADASRELAQRWSDENLEDLEFTRVEAFRGEILVRRVR
jgi:hypothetical protein